MRMALGVSRGSIMRMLLKEALVLTLAGVAMGIPWAIATGRITGSLLFGLAPADPWTLAAAALFFMAVGGTAGLWAAFRACSIDTMVALRAESPGRLGDRMIEISSRVFQSCSTRIEFARSPSRVSRNRRL